MYDSFTGRLHRELEAPTQQRELGMRQIMDRPVSVISFFKFVCGNFLSFWLNFWLEADHGTSHDRYLKSTFKNSLFVFDNAIHHLIY